jgi:hypothetical protein
MSFNILAVREGDAAEDPLYPAPGTEPDSVELRGDDGQPSPPLRASELVVREIPPGGSPKRLLRLKDITANLRTTDWRITVACSKYDQGGGWAPWTPSAIPVALAANAVSKARASKRRQGKMLVGQVPYRSLVSVGYKPRSLPIGRDQLRFGTFDPTADGFRGLLLDVTLPREHSGAEVARMIAAHAADRRLDWDAELDEQARAHLSAHKSPPTLPPAAGQFASYFLINIAHPPMVAAFQKA